MASQGVSTGSIVTVAVGSALLYGAVTGKSPVQMLHLAVLGQNPKGAASTQAIDTSVITASEGGTPGETGSGGPPIQGTSTGYQEIARQIIAAQYPSWNNQTDWDALVKLWNQESGWNNTANNPDSGAYGIAQALPPSKYPKAAQPPYMGGSADATAQIRWGLSYIRGRYGSPRMAWAHEVANNWY